MTIAEWREMKLGDLCALRAGSVFKTHHQGSSEGDLPFIKVSDMNLRGNEIRIQRANHWISDDVLSQIKAKPFTEGTTVFAKIGEALKQNRVRLLSRDTLIDNNLMGAIPKRDVVDPRFLYYRLSDFDIASKATGAALPFLSAGTLAESRFAVPPIPIQKKIASILGSYDDLIINNERRIYLLEQSARLLFKEWFIYLRYPGHERDKMVDGVPDGWERKTLGDFLTLKRGYDLPEGKRIYGDVPIVSSSGITGFHNEKKAKAPGIVTGRYGTLGEVFFIDRDYWPLNTALYVSDFKRNPTIFLVHVLKQVLVKIQSDKAAVPGLNRNVLHTMKVLGPPNSLRQQFEEVAAPNYRQIQVLNRCNEKLCVARDLLLPRLMNGRLSV